jgi:hypothetical protein
MLPPPVPYFLLFLYGLASSSRLGLFLTSHMSESTVNRIWIAPHKNYGMVFTRVVDPDPIRIRDFVDPDPYWESRSGTWGKKTKKFQWKKCTF